MIDWDEKPELNITPLVDVMLVLLAILMVISPNIVYEELIKLPQGSASQEIMEKKELEITITQDRVVKLSAKEYKFEDFADNFIQLASSYDSQSLVRISADGRLKYDDVMSVLSTVKRSGFSNVSLVTTQ